MNKIRYQRLEEFKEFNVLLTSFSELLRLSGLKLLLLLLLLVVKVVLNRWLLECLNMDLYVFYLAALLWNSSVSPL